MVIIMAKKGILALILMLTALIAITAGVFFIISQETVTVYIDGENVTTSSTISPLSGVDVNKMNNEISEYVFNTMQSPNGTITSLKQGIHRICLSYGLDNVKIKIDSSLGENKIPVIFHIEGNSMYPTLRDGQEVTVEKTKNIQVNNIVVARSPEYGNIVKRVSQIKGDKVLLTSDNTNVEYKVINGTTYKIEGIRTWVSIDDIIGIVVQY